VDDRREREIQEEIEFHRAMREKKYRNEYGLSAKAASERAKKDFGGFERWKEACRDVGQWRFLEESKRDLALALRLLRKSPLFTSVSLGTLTLAIGATTSIFSVMNAVLIKSLPIPEAHRLILLARPQSPSNEHFSYPLFKTIERDAGSAMEVFAFQKRALQFQEDGALSIVRGEFVSAKYFSALRVQPTMGRWIGTSDDRPGAAGGAVAVVSDHFWHSKLHGDTAALGRALILNKTVFTVIGVMPKSFRGMEQDSVTDLYLPLEVEPAIDSPLNLIKAGSRASWLKVGARLASGITPERANTFLKTKFSRQFQKPEKEYIAALPGDKGSSTLRSQFTKPLTVLMGLAVLVLLLACLNLASLLTARAVSREREIGIRFALGASRGRVLRQLFTECSLLTTMGTMLGLAFSLMTARGLAAMLSAERPDAPIAFDVSPDGTVLLFLAGTLSVAAIMSGIFPALRTTRGGRELQTKQKLAWRTTLLGTFSPRLLLSVEVALALVLTTSAVLLSSSLVKLRSTPLGFDSKGLFFLSLDLSKHPIDSRGMDTAYRQIVQSIKELPGVEGVSLSDSVPASENDMPEQVTTSSGNKIPVGRLLVGPSYFQTIRGQVLGGRELQWGDGSAGNPMILNLSAARLLYPGQNALGQPLSLRSNGATGQVVGIVDDIKNGALRERVQPTIYLPALSKNALVGMEFTLVVRVNGPANSIIAEAQNIVSRVLPDIPRLTAFSMEQLIAESTATESAMARLALFFGALALLVAAIGLYGSLAYAVERRTDEIGVRVALGATPHKIVSFVAKENLGIALVGGAAGIIASAAASKTIASFLYGVSPTDPLLFGFAATLLLGMAVCASLMPAWKASRVDPASAIRQD
jgi:predicted permease